MQAEQPKVTSSKNHLEVMSGISDEDSEKMGGKMKREMFQNSREAG
jgi:hypothetical protein